MKQLTGICRIFTVLCLLVLNISPAACAGDSKTIRVGVFDTVGYYSSDEQGNPDGYGYAYLDEISKISGLQFEFVRASLADAMIKLENGEIDLLDAMQKSPEREKSFLFSQYSTGTSYGKLYARADDPRLSYNNFASFNGMKTGMHRGSNRNVNFRKFAAANNFSVREVMFSDNQDMKEAFARGELDAMVSSNIMKSDGAKIIARFGPKPFFMMTTRDKYALMDDINEALEQIQVMNPSFNTDLLNRFFATDKSELVLTEKEQEYIESHETISVVYDSFWAPFESYNKETNSPAGINYEILKLIAEKTGLKFKFLHGYSYDDALDMVSRKDADMLLSYDTNPQKAKDLNIALSGTFLETPIAIIGRAYSISPDSIFSISQMHPVIQAFIKKNFPDNKMIIMPSIEDCYQAIQDGGADFTAENIYAANRVIQSGRYGSLAVTSVTTLADKFSFAFKGDIDYRLLSIFNKALLTIPTRDKETLIFSYTTNASAGDSLDGLIKRYRLPILVAFNVMFAALVLSLFFMLFQEVRNRKNFWKMAYIDPLTGLPNLNKFKLDAQNMLNKNPGGQYLLSIVDINNFNLINEIYGFSEGDRVLCTIQKALAQTMDQNSDLLARMHADNFILMAEHTLFDDAALRAVYESFRQRATELTGHQLRFSVGRYFLAPGERDITAAFEKVNYAHSVAKQNAALGDIYDYDDDMKKQAIRNREIESSMERALRKNEFVVYLQPKYCLDDKSLVGVEALVRWQTQDNEEITYPSEFVPLFEKNGFIVKLDMYMFDKSCQILRKWTSQGDPLTTISVNFSRLHLQNPDFVKEIIEIAEKYDVPKRYLEIELTESTIFDNETILESVLTKLHNAGFTLSMDDFGTGYSSLGLLKNLPVDVIKIDRTFFTDNRYKTRAKTVIENVIAMAKELGIHTVAEGVETAEHVDFLRAIGCESVQGYYFARPMPADSFSTRDMPVKPDDREAECKLRMDLLGDINLGRPELGSEVPVIVYRLFEFAVKEALSSIYGDGEMEEAMRYAGKISGRVLATEALNLNLPPEAFMQHLSDKLQELKIGMFSADSFNPDTGVAVFSITNDLDCSGTAAAGKSLCHYDEGLISGILYEYTQNTYAVVETECWGNGSNLCRFEATPKY